MRRLVQSARPLRIFALAASLVACSGTGERGVLAEISEPIIDGYVDEADKAVVGLAISGVTRSGYPFFGGHCTGTLIAPNLVLTARHCVSATDTPEELGVNCGMTQFYEQGPGELFRATTLTERPFNDGPEFYVGTSLVRTPSGVGAADFCGFDVALILLDRNVPAEEATAVVPRIDQSPREGETFSAVGYGLTDPDDVHSGGIRMRLDGQFVSCSSGSCDSVSGGTVKESEWMGTALTCGGDSGGPALDEQGRVIGVLSRGRDPCLEPVYGDVAAWRDLIIDTALEAAELGGYDAPFWARTGDSTPPPPPEPDPLGQTCNGPCAQGYACLSNDGSSGICVPPCSEAAASCPAGYRCDVGLGACTPRSPPLSGDSSSQDDGGCSVSTRGPAEPIPWLFGAAALALGAWRRRRVC